MAEPTHLQIVFYSVSTMLILFAAFTGIVWQMMRSMAVTTESRKEDLQRNVMMMKADLTAQLEAFRVEMRGIVLDHVRRAEYSELATEVRRIAVEQGRIGGALKAAEDSLYDHRHTIPAHPDQ